MIAEFEPSLDYNTPASVAQGRRTKVKRVSKLLLDEASSSLVLSIELFNRPTNVGRVSGSLIQLDHSLEMLMKAAIHHRGGTIKKRTSSLTIGFDTCIRKALSDVNVKYLTDEQAIVLRAINKVRGAAQHYLIDISEPQLYIHMQSGVTVFRDILVDVFDLELYNTLPRRVLPISSSPPTDLITLFDSELREIKKLLAPGRRRRIEAMMRLHPLMILDGVLSGGSDQPTDSELMAVCEDLRTTNAPMSILTGVTTVTIDSTHEGPHLSLRLSKKKGVPVQLVQEDTPDATVVAVKRVNELDYYNLNATQLATHLGLTTPKTIAIVDQKGLREDPDCYKEIRIGRVVHKRYSQKAISRIRSILEEETVGEIWAQRQAVVRQRR